MDEAAAAVEKEQGRIETKNAAAMQSAKHVLDQANERLDALEKEYNVAKESGQRAVAAFRDGTTPPAPPTASGRAYRDRLNEMLQGRKLVSLTAEEKKLAQPLVQQLGLEWGSVLKATEQKMGKLKQRIEHFRDQHRRAVKQADAERKADPLLRTAQELLALTQKRSKRFEALAKLFTGHRRTLRSRHAATHAFPAVPHTTRSHPGPPCARQAARALTRTPRARLRAHGQIQLRTTRDGGTLSPPLPTRTFAQARAQAPAQAPASGSLLAEARALVAGQFLEGEVLSDGEGPDDGEEDAPAASSVVGAAASALAGATVSAVSAAASAAASVATNAASAVKDAFAATVEAPASDEQHQCISLAIERPGPLQLAVREGRVACVRALLSAASGGERCSDWAATPCALAATDLAFDLALEAARDARPSLSDAIAVLRLLLSAMPPRALLEWAMGRRSDAQIRLEEARLGPGADLSPKAAFSRQLAPPGTEPDVRKQCTERLRDLITGGDKGRDAYIELARLSGAAGTPQELQQVLAAAGELQLDQTPPPLLRAMLLAEAAEEDALPPLPTRWAASDGRALLGALLEALKGCAQGEACERAAAGFGPLHLVTLALSPNLDPNPNPSPNPNPNRVPDQACALGRRADALALVGAGFPLLAPTLLTRVSALHVAALNGQCELLSALLAPLLTAPGSPPPELAGQVEQSLSAVLLEVAGAIGLPQAAEELAKKQQVSEEALMLARDVRSEP